MKSVNDIYTAVNARLVAAAVSAAVLADVDTIFHGPAEPVPETGYDASTYPVRGTGMNAWIAAGRPNYDVAGRELDNTGFPTGKMKDGSSGDGSAAAEPDFGAGERIDVVLTNETTQTRSFSARRGSYWLDAGEGGSVGDIDWQIVQNGTVVASGNGSSAEAFPYSLSDGPATFNTILNTAALTPEIIAERKAAGQGLAHGTYQQRRA